MIGDWQLILSGLFCGLAALGAATYLVAARPSKRRRGIWLLESAEAFDRRMRRRRLGAALLIVISAALFVGLSLLQPTSAPSGYVAYWLIVLAMLVWLVGLGLIDLMQTRRLFRKTSTREQAPPEQEQPE